MIGNQNRLLAMILQKKSRN